MQRRLIYHHVSLAFALPVSYWILCLSDIYIFHVWDIRILACKGNSLFIPRKVPLLYRKTKCFNTDRSNPKYFWSSRTFGLVTCIKFLVEHGTFWVSLRETISVLLMRVLTCKISFFISLQILGETKHWKQRWTWYSSFACKFCVTSLAPQVNNFLHPISLVVILSDIEGDSG